MPAFQPVCFNRCHVSFQWHPIFFSIAIKFDPLLIFPLSFAIKILPKFEATRWINLIFIKIKYETSFNHGQ